MNPLCISLWRSKCMHINVDRDVACLKLGRVAQSGYVSGYRYVSLRGRESRVDPGLVPDFCGG